MKERKMRGIQRARGSTLSVFGSLLLCVACHRDRVPEPESIAVAPPVAAPLPTRAAPALTAEVSAAVPAAVGSAHPPRPGVEISAGPRGKIKHVFVIALENHDSDEIYGDAVNAPYLHGLIAKYAHTENFEDELPLEIPSEGHYVWMEAGTHHFSDVTFVDDEDPSPQVSTGSPKHLVTQIKAAGGGLSWMSYQEGLNEKTGACPIKFSGFYVPKHNPFIFFRDVAGDPPSKDNAYCAEHHRPYAALESDLAQDQVASYVFITPDECHDMHNQPGCPDENPIRTGDNWLKAELPRLIAYAEKHSSVIFLTFDEGGSTNLLPFIAIGAGVKPHYTSKVRYTHSSQLKSVELILGVPVLPAVSEANDFSDLFLPGSFP